MPPLMNLRSVVAKVGRSMGSRRGFSASPYVTKEVHGRLSDAGAGETKHSVVIPYLVFGYCVYVYAEIIRMIEYNRKVTKAREDYESSRWKMLLKKQQSSPVLYNVFDAVNYKDK